jgi:predicted O-methyltransferase YrrM
MNFRQNIKRFIIDLNERRIKSKAQKQYPLLTTAFSIQSHLTHQERLTLFKLARDKKAILEIGSYIGCSATCFGAAMDGREGRIFCIDTWQNDAMTEGGRDTEAEFKNNTKEFASLIIPIRGFSTDVVGKVRNLTEKLDLLFIDGDHSYEGAKGDWEAYKEFVSSGSVVVCHDIGWAEGVKKVVREDILPKTSTSGQLPNLWWGTIK